MSRRLFFIAGCCVLAGTMLAILPSRGADEPAPRRVADYSSQWFLLHTDLPEDDARALLEKLESMLRIMSQYWNAPPRKAIECYVVDDVSLWPPGSLDDDKRAAVQNGGVTHARGVLRGRFQDMTAVVFASSKFGTPQHEAVHAYCYHAFGINGPTWYAEGMAEMGTYWVEGSSAVNCPDYIVDFLKNSPRPTIDAITARDQQTGDGWQNYAWRWALCHFLVTNPNYRDRFRQFGAATVSGQTPSFERSFAPQRDELEFEFAFFLDHLERGFDLDRCSWDWKKKFRALTGKRDQTAKINAGRGWQPTGARLKADGTYVVDVAGEWTVDKEVESSPPASEIAQPGSVVGCLLNDGKLSEPFLIASSQTWTPPGDGDLYVRCNDEWTQLSDNDGEVTVMIRAGPSAIP